MDGEALCCSPWGHKELDMFEQLNSTSVDATTVENSTKFSQIVKNRPTICYNNSTLGYLSKENENTRIAVVVAQSLSPVWLFATCWTTVHQSPLSSTISWSLLKFMSIESMMLSNHIILCLFFCLQSFPGSASFPISWLFTSDGQSTEASASSVLPMNIQDFNI